MKYRFNGLKSPLWGGLHNPLFSPFSGSAIAGGGAEFSPLDIAGLVGAWDGSDTAKLWQDTAGTTAITASGQSVARVDDMSGNGYHIIQTTAANRPTYTDDANGRYLLFDGVNDVLRVANFDMTATDECTIVVSQHKVSDTYVGYLVDMGYDFGASAGAAIASPAFSTAAGYAAISHGTSTALAHNAPSSPAPDTCVLALLAKIATDTLTLRRNSAQIASAAANHGTGNYSVATLSVGDAISPGAAFNGRVFRLAIYARQLTDSELSLVEKWAGSPAGVML